VMAHLCEMYRRSIPTEAQLARSEQFNQEASS